MFNFIQRYIYGGVVLFENHNASFIFELMLIAYEFLFDELAKHLETHLIETEAHWLHLHFTQIYQKIFQNNKLQELQKWCNDIVVKHPEKIFDSHEFITIQENALVSIISRDDLQTDEVKIWNYIIEWVIAQNLGLPTDPEDWSNENFLALKTTLQNCLPHIRYFQMSGDDIFNYVLPYHQILEKNLWKDMIKMFMTDQPISSKILPPRIILKLPTRNVDPPSKVINEAHATEIASWIDKKENTYSVTNNPYKFKLILRGTRDGFTKDSFWKLCDKRTHLVVVMKVKGTDEILGGYNPIGWDKPIIDIFFKECKDSFIFSLKNGTIQNSTLSRVEDPETAICCSSHYGPAFGGGMFDPDLLVIYDDHIQKWWNCQTSYEQTIRNESTFDCFSVSFFSVEEYEVFQITKKS
ncbi:hypothetical protein C2G38_1311920 [Gigaspora rosea]|uniref:TLDc domain-containing protein n=1 Tax=Gigaspora rosea TaxID=44941 RepID=A0A397VC59_9GLOM|nr:hypothetical protein C2G38_1311920 [Gigaspora rosea]